MSASPKKISARPPRRARQLGHMPAFEALEERQHFSVVTVTNTADSGTGSLRAAITAVNAGTDKTIDFAIPTTDSGYNITSPGLWTINLKAALPTLNRPVTIDGYTQTGSTTPAIEINGDGIPASSASTGVVGFNEQGGKTTIRGLYMDNFNTAIVLSDTAIGGDSVDGNLFGQYAGHRGMGTAILVEAPNCKIGVNVKNSITCGSTTARGIEILNTHNDTVSNNMLVGGEYGVLIQGDSTKNNVSSNSLEGGADEQGICLKSGATDNTIADNQVTGANFGIFLDAISGGNSIVGNQVTDSYSTGIQVESNTNTVGTTTNGNTVSYSSSLTSTSTNSDGIVISGSVNSVVGNTATGNAGYGIHLESVNGDTATANSNTIQGNKLSNDAMGEIAISDGAHGNLIGGYDNAAEANVISFDTSVGVSVAKDSYGNAIVGNSISMLESAPGIDLNGGGNDGLTAPVITSAIGFSGETTVTGTLHSYADSSVRVELFSSPAGYTDQGQTYLGSETVTTDSAGNATFSDTLTGSELVGDEVTATATVSRRMVEPGTHLVVFEGGTSAFSNSETGVFFEPGINPHFPSMLN